MGCVPPRPLVPPRPPVRAKVPMPSGSQEDRCPDCMRWLSTPGPCPVCDKGDDGPSASFFGQHAKPGYQIKHPPARADMGRRG
jgi:hypothetical protein